MGLPRVRLIVLPPPVIIFKLVAYTNFMFWVSSACWNMAVPRVHLMLSPYVLAFQLLGVAANGIAIAPHSGLRSHIRTAASPSTASAKAFFTLRTLRQLPTVQSGAPVIFSPDAGYKYLFFALNGTCNVTIVMTTPQDPAMNESRADFLKNKVTVNFFNWRSNEDKRLGHPESPVSTEAIQHLIAWVRNNWRLRKSATKESGPNKGTVRVIDVVRRNKGKAILDEVKTILGREDVDPASQDAFEKWNQGASQVIKNMTPEELAEVKKQVKEWNEKGSPPEEQRRKAERHGHKRVVDEDLQRYRDMGMLCLTFVAFCGADGQVQVRSHDTMARNAKINFKTFAEVHPQLVLETKRKVLDYAICLQRSAEKTPQVHLEPTTERPRVDLQLHAGKDGFPQLPAPPESAHKHPDLVRVVRAFLNTHYKLASGYTRESAPYSTVEKDNRAWIHAEYLLRGVVIQDPGNMKSEELSKIPSVIDFWRNREAEHGPAETFRWSSYLKNKGQKVPAEYGRRHDQDAAAEKAAKKKKQTNARRKDKSTKEANPHPTLLAMDELPDIHPPDSNSHGVIGGPPAPATTPPQSPHTRQVQASVETVQKSPTSAPRGMTPDTAAQGADADADADADAEGPRSPLASAPAPVLENPTEGANSPFAYLPDQIATVEINEETMQRLIAKGVASQPPSNGPADGAPRYIVPVTELRRLENCQPEAEAPSRKRKAPPAPSDTRKPKSRNSNHLMQMEANNILQGPSALGNASGRTTRNSVQQGKGAPRSTRANSAVKPASSSGRGGRR
ncbi:hypothetical protein FPV67DRAFT_1456574 [Lyophyllum atratum]|nr:hypothetical protein FPV67DRAFT_1456574 [Lyophyllum atratum]